MRHTCTLTSKLWSTSRSTPRAATPILLRQAVVPSLVMSQAGLIFHTPVIVVCVIMWSFLSRLGTNRVSPASLPKLLFGCVPFPSPP